MGDVSLAIAAHPSFQPRRHSTPRSIRTVSNVTTENSTLIDTTARLRQVGMQNAAKGHNAIAVYPTSKKPAEYNRLATGAQPQQTSLYIVYIYSLNATKVASSTATRRGLAVNGRQDVTSFILGWL